jgi:hypothetical protein
VPDRDDDLVGAIVGNGKFNRIRWLEVHSVSVEVVVGIDGTFVTQRRKA